MKCNDFKQMKCMKQHTIFRGEPLQKISNDLYLTTRVFSEILTHRLCNINVEDDSNVVQCLICLYKSGKHSSS